MCGSAAVRLVASAYSHFYFCLFACLPLSFFDVFTVRTRLSNVSNINRKINLPLVLAFIRCVRARAKIIIFFVSLCFVERRHIDECLYTTKREMEWPNIFILFEQQMPTRISICTLTCSIYNLHLHCTRVHTAARKYGDDR